MMNRIKAQSAMEFLMTYGWAVLIIAVVLAALFSLGVFSSTSLVSTSCIASSGYLCQVPIFGVNGNLSFTLGQITGRPIYNIGLACAGTATTAGLPNPSPLTTGNAAMVYIIANGFPSSIPSNVANFGVGSIMIGNSLTLSSGQTIPITQLSCYGASGADIVNVPFGTSFTGGIWLNYTQQNQVPSASNPLITMKIALITAKAV